MVESRTTEVEDSEADVEDVNKVDVERSDDDREVDIQTGGLAVDVDKDEQDGGEA